MEVKISLNEHQPDSDTDECGGNWVVQLKVGKNEWTGNRNE